MKVNETATDFISELPDEIIHFIFSFMTLQEAGRTSVLSHRWGDLWKTYMCFMPDLFLDAKNLMGSDYSCRQFKSKSRMTAADYQSLENDRQKFVRRVNQFLQLYQSPFMKSFKLRFDLDIGYSSEIDEWVQTVISKKAMKLDIDLSEFGNCKFLNLSLDELYIFPDWIFPKETASFLRYVSLTCCVCTPEHDFSGFNSLLELRLETVYIYDENIGQILANSSHLERLSLINCWNLHNLKICGRNLVLKELTVVNCSSLGRIELNAINLTYFEYSGAPVGLAFENVPQLINVGINTIRHDIMAGMSYALGTLSTVLPQVKFLRLSTMTIEKSMIPARVPTYTHLKQLVLKVSWVKGNLFGFLAILGATPYLERFELHLPELRDRKAVRKVRRPAACPLIHLKEVVISGLVWIQGEIDFLIHLVKNAEAINTVTIIPAKVTYRRIGGVFHFVDDKRDGSSADASASQAGIGTITLKMANRIRKVLPAGANLIIK